MRRPFLIALLALGTVGGFASGFHRLRHGSCGGWGGGGYAGHGGWSRGGCETRHGGGYDSRWGGSNAPCPDASAHRAPTGPSAP